MYGGEGRGGGRDYLSCTTSAQIDTTVSASVVRIERTPSATRAADIRASERPKRETCGGIQIAVTQPTRGCTRRREAPGRRPSPFAEPVYRGIRFFQRGFYRSRTCDQLASPHLRRRVCMQSGALITKCSKDVPSKYFVALRASFNAFLVVPI